MTATIKIVDLEVFDKYISAVNKLVNSCKFIIGDKECTILSIDENQVFRVSFKTNAVISDTPVSFCLNELVKFSRSISTLKEFKGSEHNTATFTYDGNFIELKDVVKFKLKLVKEEVIQRYIDKEITAKLENLASFQLNYTLMKKLCGMSFISTADDSHKLYLYKEGDSIIGEIDNKQMNIRDSIAIPISKNFTGDWSTPLICKLDHFRMWNLLDVPEITVNVIKQGAFVITNSANKNGIVSNVKIISPMLKQ